MTRALDPSVDRDPARPTGPSFEKVLAHVADRSAEFTEKRHVPRDMIEEFKQVGLYRATTPKRFGGDALPPAAFLRLIERISEVDGSAGWVASFGSSGVYLAGLPLDTQAELYAAGPDVVFAGGLFPLQPAEQTDGGFRVSGHWRFASGCKGADLLGVGIGVGDASSGKPRTAVLRPEQVQIVENWDVIGMQGTGSHDLKVDGVVVPEEWTFVRGGGSEVDEPLYRYPTIAYAAQVLAVVNLGIARAALDHTIRVGAGRVGLTGAPKLADRAYYRIAVAKAEAELRSVRSFFYEVTEEVYQAVAQGAPATAEQAGVLRLAATHAARVGFDVVRDTYTLSGTAAINADHPMQRYLRDASVVPQHAFLTEGMYDGAGAVLMGAKPFAGFV
ncbi:acyl-CoA dehydrogenase family protein [Streptomyces sp. NBC_01373]|uniref:acyl-CoA dehydrogenase family protein n=1 Tax=Streptomyces sp. NBC_01373 TaxID=2903843 RepID=UPI00225280F8|nr:acyl-CoA dehydrogenase family protein [Streptomyces sp. NBC_01373]MCX4703180.1 acyl-CoA dehydrogenase family protein [Streptomyces sp. NBC_01373]